MYNNSKGGNMRYFIDNNSNLANYSQLMNQIKEKIYNHELKENDQLPSIRLLAKELHIAIITVRRFCRVETRERLFCEKAILATTIGR